MTLAVSDVASGGFVNYRQFVEKYARAYHRGSAPDQFKDDRIVAPGTSRKFLSLQHGDLMWKPVVAVDHAVKATFLNHFSGPENRLGTLRRRSRFG